MLLWIEVSWNPRVKFGLNNTFDAKKKTFGADSDDVSVWKIVLDLHSWMGPTSSIHSSCAQQISRNMVVPLHNTTLTYKFLRMSASHFVLYFAVDLSSVS